MNKPLGIGWSVPPLRVLVCGGRDYADAERVAEVLTAICQDDAVIIHGAAKGADALADVWAREHGLRVERYPADWRKYGRRAGPVRNQQMLDEGKPDLVVAFPGGRGTADMVKRARAAGVAVQEVAHTRG